MCQDVLPHDDDLVLSLDATTHDAAGGVLATAVHEVARVGDGEDTLPLVASLVYLLT